MIVVAGGSGLLGRLLVGDLLAEGRQVRVLVRDPARARDLFGDAVEVVAADVRQPEEVRAAVAGAELVVSAVHGFLGGRGAGPAEVDDRGNGNLIDAAGEVGAGVVLMSVSGASPTHPVDLFRAKYAAEQHLRGAGVPWTIVRAPAYRETWLGILAATAGSGERPLIFGVGDRPIPFVSVADVAAVVVAAIDDPTARGRVIEVPGTPMTMTGLAHELQASRGWHGSVRHVPRPALRVLSVLARPVSPAFARQNRAALAMDTGVPSGRQPRPGQSRPAHGS
ncbi:SDR family oxidoreductase [Leifsonia sp. 2TAF2]|uniref:SDR family oxidoreductase n=1 Tax=Leifsonia sp. 2TAF2 TaxID=3233009 RepID=UPI003F955C3E